MNSGRLVLGAIFLALAGTAAWLLMADGAATERGRGPRAVSVVTTPATQRTFTDIVEALGTANARESVTLTSRVSDTVREVHFSDGDIVKAGQVLVVLEDIEEKAQLQEAEANLREAERSFRRIENLVKQGNASSAALDTERRRLDEARFRVDASAARLADQRIKAPFDGLLGLRQISEGTLITPNTPITTIDAIDTIKLDFSVPERFIATLKPGQDVEAKVSAYPDRLFKGVVTTIDSRVDPVTRSVIVRAEIPNEDHALRPGLLMRVEVINRSWQAIGVPEESVVPTGGKTFVFVVKDGEAERREVTLGLRRPGYVEVTRGLEAGERVVTEGTMRLGRMGMKVIDMAADKAAGDAS
ncbi:efflux RND transporter periplasmic adaptor subunit [Kordiimonas lacus]|uniref:Membrane fusion protein, multidrug efflux system n=1 Tax=Kordiimonas lacus TaxID=637679 RepID=A0A1G7CN30_9PROT|nr:efflux RND transporter periplasmic adaptor subunit [Kordiimonas lacus]SDE39845.1 membrane fusion protein, multidrug efflux system [Kordiimonas lacus]